MRLATTLKDGQLAWDDDLPVATQGWLCYNGGMMVVSHGCLPHERGADRRPKQGVLLAASVYISALHHMIGTSAVITAAVVSAA
jgi:hypothetical protein